MDFLLGSLVRVAVLVQAFTVQERQGDVSAAAVGGLDKLPCPSVGHTSEVHVEDLDPR